jgi:DNA-binding Lrp family transcriptional regulator
LVVGSSPTGPTKLKAAHCAAFVFPGFWGFAFQTPQKPVCVHKTSTASPIAPPLLTACPGLGHKPVTSLISSNSEPIKLINRLTKDKLQDCQTRSTLEPPLPDTRPPALDEIDRQLIAALQLNARESVAMLARQLGIARTTVTSRLARLEKTGVITGYGVRLGQRLIDGGLQAYVGITVQPRSGKDVVRRLSAMARCSSCAQSVANSIMWPGCAATRPSNLTSCSIKSAVSKASRKPPPPSSSAVKLIADKSFRLPSSSYRPNKSHNDDTLRLIYVFYAAYHGACLFLYSRLRLGRQQGQP